MMLMGNVGLFIVYPACIVLVKLKHRNWCNANLLSLIILSYLNPISLNTLLSDVLPLNKTLPEVLTDDGVTKQWLQC